MREYYEAPGRQWEQCTPGGVSASSVTLAQPVRDCLRLGGIGARVRWKGWAHVIAALALLPPALRSRVTFTHIGGGDAGCSAALAAQAAAAGLASQVIFRGVEASSDALLGEIDALVVASENEPFSMAMLEALAAGVPVLAADSGGSLDLIQPGVNGALYRTGDAAALAAQLQLWLEQRPAWDRTRIRATSMGIGQIATRWAKVYAEL
jgi:glycosyltransferase involved in cell wall biosynthesis